MMTVKVKRFMSKFMSDLSHLIYPNTCLACTKELASTENQLCSICLSNLSLTNFQHYEEPTQMDKLFWGRVEVSKTYAHFFFEKNKASQDILFGLKYKGNKTVGFHFGQETGKAISNQSAFSNANAIIPVPLHPKKEFKRGYNQSEIIAKGISKETGIPISLDVIKRSSYSETQTKKDRFERWDNVSNIFTVSDKIHNLNHIILVDDVITTGSTLEAIILALRDKNPKLSVSVVTLAIT